MGDYTQVPTPPADPVATASAEPDSPVSDPNRPVSTIPADSPEATSSAQPQPADASAEAKAEADSQVQPVQTPELQPDQVLEGSASASIIPSAESEPTASPSADLQPPTSESPQLPQSPQVPETPVPVASPSPSEPQSTPPEAPKETSIQDTSLPKPPPQVQPEVPVSASSVPTPPVDQPPKESAGIKPEPLQGIQNPPSADSKPPESIKSSFGDLMGNPSDLSEEPAIHIDPIEAPTATEPLPPLSVEPQSDTASLRRHHATEVRKQKRADNLAKILEFVQTKGKVDNLDIRDFLHISQTTATDYLHTLVNSGKLKKEGKAKATKYSL